MKKTILFICAACALFIISCDSKETTTLATPEEKAFSEKHRPQLHFSPPAHWMNDPNGMVLYKGTYHLFYQHYPDGLVWGPMHWGHATSKDLIHWEHQPIALYPDSIGLIFSGSAVVDVNNTSGLGTADNPPLVAIFTYHSVEKEKHGDTDYQNQGLAFSVDDGKTWNKFERNPVLKNQGIKDFRDPKVFWHEQSSKWVMILAVKDHVELWGSKNLTSWSKLSDFGLDYGAHGGVWECPDLIQLPMEGQPQSKWVMLVSLNPGGPNGGSSTQYFTGDFDGTNFKPDLDESVTSWIDYGPDNYAGVTWSNIPQGRKVFLGWMSNWAYAQNVPTSPWRSAMTVPRDLALKEVNGRIYLTSQVAAELAASATSNERILNSQLLSDTLRLNADDEDLSKSVISITADAKDFSLEFSNAAGQKVAIGFDSKTNQFYIDRSKSGSVSFSNQFPLILRAPRISQNEAVNVTIVADVSSVEVFFDDGLTVMTSVFFPDEPLSNVMVKGQSLNVSGINIKALNSIW